MFFGIDKRDFNLSRWRAGLPFFLIFWLGVIAIFLFLAILVRGSLHNFEIHETEQLVAAFLRQNTLSDIYRETGGFENTQQLGGLTFVRLIHGHDHLIRIQETSRSSLNFQDLVDLTPERVGVWLSLKKNKDSGVLTVVSRKLAGGVVLQAGKDAHVTREIYRRVQVVVVMSTVCSFFLAWLFALWCVKKSLKPLNQVGERLAAIWQNHGDAGFQKTTKIPELDAVLEHIEQLARNNRSLIIEMQASLDNVAHDLRTPMTRLRSVAEYGLQSVDEPQRLRDALSDCLEESERVLAMLRIMMTVAEAESGTMHLVLEPCDVEESLRDIVDLYAYVAEEKNIEVHLSLEPSLKTVADKTRMSQVWGNLLDNAIKYGKTGGQVLIRATRNDGRLQIDFEDNGMGISKNEMTRIWDRLYRGDRSRTQQGLGLGLNYVRAVVQAHGGEVKVRSTLHQGSCFSVYLPSS